MSVEKELRIRKESGIMKLGLSQNIMTILGFIVLAVNVYVVFLVIKALRRYTKSEAVRKEKAENAKTLGEVIKQHRMVCKMTQEFVAESLGVSRQAVSKWESGASDPSTTNLMALAKLFGVEAEDLLKETR
jgi:DNA-binding XRE family transcriptional regulator